MGDIPEADQTPPPAPSKLKLKKNGDQGILKWEASEEDTPGSWVVAYHIYYDGTLLAKAYGTQYTFQATGQKRKKFKVKAINATGVESL